MNQKKMGQEFKAIEQHYNVKIPYTKFKNSLQFHRIRRCPYFILNRLGFDIPSLQLLHKWNSTFRYENNSNQQ